MRYFILNIVMVLVTACSSKSDTSRYLGEFKFGKENHEIGLSLDFEAIPPIILTKGLYGLSDKPQWMQVENEKWTGNEVKFSTPWGVPGKALSLNWKIKLLNDFDPYTKPEKYLKIELESLDSLEPQIATQNINLKVK